ncbi:MAG: UUP1 family membrane protein, partial [Solirubrobacteraceae bacterium]
MLIALGLSIFAWKTMVLQLPVLPSNVENLWRVELEIVARGAGQRGSVRAAVPSPDEEQEIFDERQTSDRLVFTVRTENGQRTGVWSGKFDDVHSISYAFRVQIADSPLALPANLAEKPPKELFDANTKSTSRFPVDAPEVRELVASIAPPAPSDPLGQMRTLLGYVTDEILTVNTGSDDALLTLAASEG